MGPQVCRRTNAHVVEGGVPATDMADKSTKAWDSGTLHGEAKWEVQCKEC